MKAKNITIGLSVCIAVLGSLYAGHAMRAGAGMLQGSGGSGSMSYDSGLFSSMFYGSMLSDSGLFGSEQHESEFSGSGTAAYDGGGYGSLTYSRETEWYDRETERYGRENGNVPVDGVITSVDGAAGRKAPVVVLDAGHGGDDPGKVGLAGTLEKEINLNIVKKLKMLLEQNGVTVILTREEDTDLAEPGASNRKSQDMKARIEVLREAKPELAVSIHQNSYPSETCKGAQVFYYKSSPEGEVLAKILQKQLVTELNDGNTRQAKANGDYYLLKHSPCTFAIVECGFLSNSEEEQLLGKEEYQEKVAFAIHLGILQYLEERTPGE